MPVKNGDLVKVEYEGTLDDGEIFDSTDNHDGSPLEFVAGAHDVLEGFENAVLGKEIGDEISIKIEPKDGYGMYNKDAVEKVPKSEFPPDLVPEVGMILQMSHEHEDHVHDMPVWITEVDDDSVTIDYNHPLAGKVLHFKIKIIDIEETQLSEES